MPNTAHASARRHSLDLTTVQPPATRIIELARATRARPLQCANVSPTPNVPVDLDEKLAQFDERWSPKVIARMNDYEIKVAKLEGEFVWHTS